MTYAKPAITYPQFQATQYSSNVFCDVQTLLGQPSEIHESKARGGSLKATWIFKNNNSGIVIWTGKFGANFARIPESQLAIYRKECGCYVKEEVTAYSYESVPRELLVSMLARAGIDANVAAGKNLVRSHSGDQD